MIDRLENIGFYTLCDERATNVSATSPMWRTELLITDRCNFSCPYCRGLRADCRGDISTQKAIDIINWWADDGLKHIRFSGGEPTIHAGLGDMVFTADKRNVNRIALSTNGSAEWNIYKNLFELGVNDFSISLDACCSSFGDKMAGVKGKWNRVVESILKLSELTYVTVGVVLTEDNIEETGKIIQFAHDLGVADIRVIPAAQFGKALSKVEVKQEVLDAHPILKYRFDNACNGASVRGLSCDDCRKCHLVKDDSVVAGNFHFPCVIYLREGGNPVGKISKHMRKDRLEWFEAHDVFEDKICRESCLDVCVDYNNKAESFCNERVCT